MQPLLIVSLLRVPLLPRETGGNTVFTREEATLGIVLSAVYLLIAKMPELAVENVVVHPLVLLSVVDHFNR